MRYIWQHIETIVTTYKGEVPLTHFLKNYFRQHPKLGSRDRKILSEMSYSFYRCSKALPGTLSLEDKIRTCLFLCNQPAKYTQAFFPAYSEAVLLAGTTEKINFLTESNIPVKLDDIFPFEIAFSEGTDKEEWLRAMLQQPRLFLRIRKEKQRVIEKLKAENIAYDFTGDNCLSLPNGASVDKLFPQDWYVVQDASSQETRQFFEPKKKEQWYDCCSGAGGKSLLLKDLEPSVSITVSDVRESILHNLKMRFKQYGYPAPKSYCLDVADRKQMQLQLGTQAFDSIIADVPCSGSGTWARTPEQLYFFDENFVRNISQRQTAILHNIADRIKPGGKICYITCSVFKDENENVVHEAIKGTSLKIASMQIINGLHKQADSMFIAVLV